MIGIDIVEVERIKQNLEKKALEARESLNLDKVIATINPKDLEDMDSLVDRLTAQFEEESKQLEEKQKKEQEQKEKNNSDSENNSSKEDKK